MRAANELRDDAGKRVRPVRAGRRAGRMAAVLSALLLAGCAAGGPRVHEILVTATAYNSLPSQTHDDPRIGAWGDRLDPAVPSIAVSRDLEKLGLTRGVRVRIEGFDREFFVLDRMNKRWKRRIDIHMGTDRRAALEWGKREVRISWVGR